MDAPTVLRGGYILDLDGGEANSNSGIVIVGGRIMEMGAELSGRDLTGFRIVELGENHFILPGLLDLHAHYEVEVLDLGRRDEYQTNSLIFLANGVTTTFPAGESDPAAMADARRRIDSGGAIGPRILNSGPRFGPQWSGWDSTWNPGEVRGLVDHWVSEGVTGFKAKGADPEQLSALIERAHAHGRTVTGHLMSNDTINPQTGIEMGIDRIEHYLGGPAFRSDRYVYDSMDQFRPGTEEFDTIAGLFISRRVYFTPTITAFGYLGNREDVFDYWLDEREFFTECVRSWLEQVPARDPHPRWDRIQRNHREVVKAFHDSGGEDLITLGTDTPARGEFLAGFNAHRELHNLVLGGIPPASALRIATINGARALGVSHLLGSVDVGKLADLFVVEGDPLEDIRNTRNVRYVMKNGELYDPGELLEAARGGLGPRRGSAGECDWA